MQKTKEFINTWINKLQGARETIENNEEVRFRVGHLINGLLKLSDEKKVKIIQDSILEFSNACDDRALSGLEMAEFLVLSLGGDEKTVFNNVLAQVKKIQLNKFLYAYPSYDKDGNIIFNPRSKRNTNVTEESLETALYHELLFSNFGNFGVKSKFMAHNSYAQSSRADVALDYVLGELTFENIISAIMSEEVFDSFRSFALNIHLKKLLPTMKAIHSMTTLKVIYPFL